MPLPETSILVVLGISLIFFELLFGALAGLDIFFLGASFIIGGVSGVFNNSWLSMIAITVVVYLVYLLFLRRSIRAKVMLFLQQTGVVDTLVGKEVKLISTDTKTKKSRVLINGELWDALPPKSTIRGRALFVSRCKNGILELEVDSE